LLRISGDNVQTSRGAEVPIADARRAVAFVMAVRARGDAWKRNGERFPVGAFELDAIESDGTVRAGCHTFEFAEVERLAALLA
jgi:hypothetical protein